MSRSKVLKLGRSTAFNPSSTAAIRSCARAPRSFSTSPSRLQHLQPYKNHISKYFAPLKPLFNTSLSLPASARRASSSAATPCELTQDEYHKISDTYMDLIVAKLEELQETRDDVDVEFSAGVLTLKFNPNGTYIINKQPPNKQIWLSSPISGPKRYDYVVQGEGQHEKEGGGTGDWIYLRDGSSLSAVLRTEIGVDIDQANID